MRKLLMWAPLLVCVVAFAACSGDSSNNSNGSGTALASANGSEFCKTLRNDVALFQKIGNRANAEQVTAALSDLAGKAPPELTGDLATIVAAYQSYALQASADPNNASLASQYSSATASLGPAFVNVTKYAKDACGIDLTNLGTDSSSSSVRGPVN